jgi:phosphatidylglycerophosphate synthase
LISAKLGHFLDKPFSPLARRITVSPNVLTITGFLITIIASLFIPFSPLVGGILILIGGFFDMLDGIVARVNDKKTEFGALLDSTLDRYSDSIIFVSIAWYFFNFNNLTGVIFTIISLVGAFLISYVRARAEGINIRCNVGLLERPERIVLIAFGCIMDLLLIIVILLSVLSHLTAIQRIIHAYKETKGRFYNKI